MWSQLLERLLLEKRLGCNGAGKETLTPDLFLGKEAL